MADPKQNPGNQNPTDKDGSNVDPAKKGSDDASASEKTDEKTVPLAALHEAREENKSLKKDLETLRTMVSSWGEQAPFGQQQQQRQQPQQQYQQQNSRSQQMDELWETDPRRAMQAEIQTALGWYDKVNTAVDYQVSQARTKYNDFDQFADQVRSYLRRIPAEQRARQGIVDLAYNVVKGQNVDTLKKKWEEDLMKKIKDGQNVQGLQGTTSAKDSTSSKDDKPTPEQIAAAEAMGLKVEDYMQGSVKK